MFIDEKTKEWGIRASTFRPITADEEEIIKLEMEKLDLPFILEKNDVAPRVTVGGTKRAPIL